MMTTIDKQIPLPQTDIPPSRLDSASSQLNGQSVLATWLLSLVFHVVLFAVMFFFPWLSSVVMEEKPSLVTLTELDGFDDAQGIRQDDLDFNPSQKDPQDSVLGEMSMRPDLTSIDQMTSLQSETEGQAELDIIGIGTGGAGDAGDFGVFGGGGAPGFFGLGPSAAEAKKIVYIVDRSGSMLEYFGFLKKELKRSLSKLRQSQKFHVIFFSNDALESHPRQLVAAIRANKSVVYEFIDQVRAEGSTNPDPAMARAFALNPDIIYFLTDGAFDAGLLPKLDRWNRERKVRIYTISYVYREGAELLEKIAREHRGEFRYISEHEVLESTSP